MMSRRSGMALLGVGIFPGRPAGRRELIVGGGAPLGGTFAPPVAVLLRGGEQGTASGRGRRSLRRLSLISVAEARTVRRKGNARGWPRGVGAFDVLMRG